MDSRLRGNDDLKVVSVIFVPMTILRRDNGGDGKTPQKDERPKSLPGNDREGDARRVLWTVVDRLKRGDRLAGSTDRLSRVEIPVEAREVAAGYLDPNRVSLLEHVARRAKVDGELVQVARFEEAGRLTRRPVSRADDVVSGISP